MLPQSGHATGSVSPVKCTLKASLPSVEHSWSFHTWLSGLFHGDGAVKGLQQASRSDCPGIWLSPRPGEALLPWS